MFNVNKRMVMSILAAVGGLSNPNALAHPSLSGINVGRVLGREKGQKRNARPNASGVAASKRAAKKRNNIRKHK